MPYDPLPSTDHQVRGLARILQAKEDDAGFQAWLSSYLKQIQKLEDATWEVIQKVGIDDLEGVGLDALGVLVGRGRNGLGDPDYRIAIRAQIRINRSSGTALDMLTIARLSVPSGFSFRLTEHFPATEQIQVLGEVNFGIAVLLENLLQAKMGGVRLILQYAERPDDELFAFSSHSYDDLDPYVPQMDPDTGYGDYDDPDTGGRYTDILTSS